jgi:hypothetical protein
MLLERRALPGVQRWARGAKGEETVGAILDGLQASGWRAIHDADTGRGNIGHVLVGPAGVLTVETKSHRGPIAVDRIDKRSSVRPTRRQSTWGASAGSGRPRCWSSAAPTWTGRSAAAAV